MVQQGVKQGGVLEQRVGLASGESRVVEQGDWILHYFHLVTRPGKQNPPHILRSIPDPIDLTSVRYASLGWKG